MALGKPSLKKKLPLRGRRAVDTNATVTTARLNPENPLPLLVQPALDGADLIAWGRDNKALLEQQLYQHGAVLFRGFGSAEPPYLTQFVEAVSGETLEYKERSSPRSQVSGNVYTSTDYPQDQTIHSHNENAYQFTWPMKLFFMAVTVSDTGGETPIADCRKVYQHIDPEVRERFREKGVRYVRNFNDRLGLSWQTVFQTEDPAVVDAYCEKNDIETQWLNDGGLRTITHRGAVAIHPVTKEPSWFNHAAFFHVTSLPADMRRMLAGMDEADLPNNTYYGDGTPIEDDVLDMLRAAYVKELVLFPWVKGDILMIDNMLTSHARAPYTGERKIVVAMSEPMNRRQLIH